MRRHTSSSCCGVRFLLLLVLLLFVWQVPTVWSQEEDDNNNNNNNEIILQEATTAPTDEEGGVVIMNEEQQQEEAQQQQQQQQEEEDSDTTCSSSLQDSCARCGWGVDFLNNPTGDTSTVNNNYNCSLPGLQDFAPGGQYAGVQANYLSHVTNVSSPQLMLRSQEFEACTGGRIVFSEAANIFEDPLEDLGTATRRGNEIYDGYFMSYSHFPEVSALGLAEPLNDRIRRDNARLKWEDVLPKVKEMGKYRHSGQERGGSETQEFLMYDGDFFVPIIRLDLLERFDMPLPNTWEEMVDYVKFFNGTDLNDDGEADYGLCHFPRDGAGSWDWWFPEMVYSTWATYSQTQGTGEGFFFDPDTMEPQFETSDAFIRSADVWKDLWIRGDSSENDSFLNGRCAIGFGPPGSWKRIFLTGVHRADDEGNIIWQPTMKDGSYAEPYRFLPFGSLTVVNKETGQLEPCNPKLCPKAEQVPVRGHHGDNDRASVLPPSPHAGKLINRAPFYWSGGLGTLIRKSAPQIQKDLIWDFFVYTNSPDTAVHDVASYRSWLDSWRYSQLSPGDNFLQAGWSQVSYEEHADIMQWALSKESNGAFNLRLPAVARYTRDVVRQGINQYIANEITMDQLIDQCTKGWNEITEEEGKLDQLEVYRSSLGLEMHSEVELCRLHRDLMDEKDPSVCRKYDESNDNTILMAVLIPVAIILVALLIFLHLERKRRKDLDMVWRIDPDELNFDDPPRILGQGTFGFVLKAEYRGTEVAVKRFSTQTASSASVSKSNGVSEFAAVSVAKRSAAKQVMYSSLAGGSDFKTKSPSDMGQTMSVQASKAMVKMVKSQPADVELKAPRWKPSCFQSPADTEYNKQRTEFIEEMKKLATLRHQCVITIMGAVLGKDDCMIVLEFMDHGSLYNILHNETMVIEGEFILSILRDIAQGIRFLHAAIPQIVHCDLKASNILVDGRMRAKVADFGLSTVESDNIGAAGTPYFLAPEILRGETSNTVESDAYAFGMVIYEVYSRKDPYEGEVPLDVLRLVADKTVNKRPPTPANCPPKAKTLMMECLCGDPRQRPTFEELDLQLKRLDVSTMEPIKEEEDAAVEQPRNDEILYNMFPKYVADALRDGRKVEPQSRQDCTLFSCEISGFSDISRDLPPVKIADLIHRLYSSFDDLCGKYDVYKVETVNDAYMCITGLVKEQEDHAKRIAEFAIAAVKAASETLVDVENPHLGTIAINVGVASGPVLANVVGTRHPRYGLFGDVVNTVSNLHELSEANRIQCSETTAVLLQEQGAHIPLKPRGLINLKGKGEVFTFFVNEEMD